MPYINLATEHLVLNDCYRLSDPAFTIFEKNWIDNQYRLIYLATIYLKEDESLSGYRMFIHELNNNNFFNYLDEIEKCLHFMFPVIHTEGLVHQMKPQMTFSC